MIDIADNIRQMKKELPQSVTLVAVSKFHPVDSLMQAYEAGQRVFGESRAQELVQKAAVMPDDVKWHFIGHLQTNKVKAVVPIVSLIHSIDSEKLLLAVNEEAAKLGRVVDVLLELHVAQEETKYGFDRQTLAQCAADGLFQKCGNVRVCGVMGMATNTDDEQEIRREFRRIVDVFRSLKAGEMSRNPDFKEISMGMSDDYRIALAEGSTMVRVGSHIFGPRQY